MRLFSTLMKATIVTTMIVLGLVACRSEKEGTSGTYTPDRTYQLTILYSSDYPNTLSEQQKQHSIAAKTNLIKTIRSEVESQGNHLVLISGGGTPSRQEEIQDYFNLLDYDALVVSSYMFNQPVADIKDLQKKSSAPFVSANIFESETGKPVFDAYTLIEADDLTLAVVGVTSPEAEKEQRINLSGLDILNTKESDNNRLIQPLRQQADIIIVATHTGHIQHSTQNLSLEGIAGINLVIGEHPQDMTLDPANNTAFSCHEYLTRVDLEFINGEIRVTNREQLFIHDRATHFMSIR